MLPLLLDLTTAQTGVLFALFAAPCADAGDYLLQTQRMQAKTTSWRWALFHGVVYTLPFLLLTLHPVALLVIGGTHALIDRLRLGARHCQTLGVGQTGTLEERLGLPVVDEAPLWLRIWLSIRADNAYHRLIEAGTLFAVWISAAD